MRELCCKLIGSDICISVLNVLIGRREQVVHGLYAALVLRALLEVRTTLDS